MPNGLFIERKPRELQALGPFSGTCQNAIILTGQYNNMTLTYVCHGPKAWKLRAFYDAIAQAPLVITFVTSMVGLLHETYARRRLCQSRRREIPLARLGKT